MAKKLIVLHSARAEHALHQRFVLLAGIQRVDQDRRVNADLRGVRADSAQRINSAKHRGGIVAQSGSARHKSAVARGFCPV